MEDSANLRAPQRPRFGTSTRRSFLVSTVQAGGTAALAATSIFASRPAIASADGNAGGDHLVFSSASKLAELIRQRKASSVEVVQAHLRRIASVNPQLNAVVFVNDQAIAQAEKADAALVNGAPTGPLHGVPVTLKDCIETANMPTTAGIPALKNGRSSADATVARKLKEAGAIILGKTNMPLLGCAWETVNDAYGRTSNPYDLSRSPGGSSGGEGAAIAAGCSPLGIGTDAGGSIRVPAHFCGIASLIPSFGRVSNAGLFPFSSAADVPFLINGPMARYVEDLALALTVISGPDQRDPYTVPLPLRDYRQVDLRTLKVAFWTDNGQFPPTAYTRDTVEQAAKNLANAGAQVHPDIFAHAADLFEIIIASIGERWPQRLLATKEQYGLERVDPFVERGIQYVSKKFVSFSKEQVADLVSLVPKLQASLLRFMQKYDVMLCPVLPYTAFRHGTSWDRDLIEGTAYPNYSAYAGLPAGTVRCGTSPEGLPIGVQVVGKRWSEGTVLAVLAHLQQGFGGWVAPPF